MIRYLLFYPAELLALCATFALLLRIPIQPRLAWTVAALAVVALLTRTPSPEGWHVDRPPPGPEGWDFKIFWDSGRALWNGTDPYTVGEIPPLNPPTAFPLFALFALLSCPVSLAVWTAVNVLGIVFLVAFGRRVLNAQRGEGDEWSLPLTAVAVLTGVVTFSSACRFGIDAGQLGLYTAWTILAALLAQARGRAVLAGLFLALATAKTATLLPFLLLFLRKSDRPTWVSLAIVSLGLCLLTTPASQLIPRCHDCLRNIGTLSQPGNANDYAYDNVVSNDIVAVDHLYYRLGFRDRKLIQTIQLATLALLGGWLAWRVIGPDPLPRPAACSAVTLYAMLFLYHRYYDMVILALPLVYAAGRALVESGSRRWLYSLSTCALLAVLTVRRSVLEYLTPFAQLDDVRSRLLGIVVMPFGSWWLLLALFALLTAERSRTLTARSQPANSTLTPTPAFAGFP